jgi:hypothetical protein
LLCVPLWDFDYQNNAARMRMTTTAIRQRLIHLP